MSELTFAQYEESAQVLRRRLGNFRPEVLLILGSGLGFLADEVRDSMAIPYAQIPHFGTSTAPGHKGRLVFGALADRQVAVMQGRLHTYEGYSMEQVSLAVRVARLLGAKRLVVTNAAGAVNTDYHAGELMLITDHIKLFGTGPLTGTNLSEFGPRFPDMSHVYTPALQQVARQAARDLGIRLNEGVYMYFPGPQYETPAEVRAARILGADAVGMSTVPETIVARHSGMDVLGLSCITNMAAGILDQPLSHQEVMETGERVKDTFRALVDGVIAAL